MKEKAGTENGRTDGWMDGLVFGLCIVTVNTDLHLTDYLFLREQIRSQINLFGNYSTPRIKKTTVYLKMWALRRYYKIM